MPQHYTRAQLLAISFSLSHMIYEHRYSGFGMVDLPALRDLIIKEIEQMPESLDEDGEPIEEVLVPKNNIDVKVAGKVTKWNDLIDGELIQGKRIFYTKTITWEEGDELPDALKFAGEL